MADVPVLGRSDDDRLFKLFAAHYDVPAYVRRARGVQDAFDALVAHCRQQREQWLKAVRLQLQETVSAAGHHAPESLVPLCTLLNVPLSPARKAVLPDRRIRRSLSRLRECIDRFNARWHRFVEALDLSALNNLREDYNRYYLLEKECALRSARLARIGFERLKPLSVADLLAVLPPLPW